MVRKNKKQIEIRLNKKYTLLTEAGVLSAYILFVHFVSQGSLSFYTIPHIAILTLLVYAALGGVRSKESIRIVLIIGFLGVVSAAYLLWSYRELLNYT